MQCPMSATLLWLIEVFRLVQRARMLAFVTDADLKNGTFTLESGNSSNIYTTRKVRCFSFHTPPNNVLSALTGTAIGNALTGLPLMFVPTISSTDPDDCGQGNLDTDNYDEIQNDDSLQREQALANSLDGERVCVPHLPPSDAPRFCPYARMTRESSMYRPRSALANQETKK